MDKELLEAIRRAHGGPVEKRFRARQRKYPNEAAGTSLSEVLKGLGPGESLAARAHSNATERIPGPEGSLEFEIVDVGVKKSRRQKKTAEEYNRQIHQECKAEFPSDEF